MCMPNRNDPGGTPAQASFYQRGIDNSFRVRTLAAGTGILASQRCRTPLRGNAYMRLLNRFSVKCLMARCCVQDMARNRDRWSRASRSGAVTRRGGDRYGLPWTNAVQVGLGTVEASRRVHGVEATPGSPAMVLVVWTDNVDTACAELAAAQVGSAPGPGKGATSADCGDVLRPAALACSRELTPRVPARRGRTGSTRRR